MGRERRILHVGVAGAICFVAGLVLAGLDVTERHAPFLPIGIAVLGMLLVGAALERRRRATDGTDDDAPTGSDLA